MLAISGAQVGVGYGVQGYNLQMIADSTDFLLFVGIGNDLPVGSVRNDRRAAGAGSVVFEKTRQQIQRDVGADAADEFAVANDRKHQGYDGIAGIRVDAGSGEGQ